MIVDDDQNTVDALVNALNLEGYSTKGTTSAERALKQLSFSPCDLVLTDLVMPGMDGMQLMQELKRRELDVPVIVCTGYGSIPSAVEAINHGAVDYLTKPVNLEQLMLVVQRALKTSSLTQENLRLKEELRLREGTREIIGRSRVIEEVFSQIRSVAPTDATVLVRGDSGTGKELVAQAIHDASHRKDNHMVTVNCAAFADTLIESELFGHEKGAFTGAYRLKKGRAELADGGTLFLDEIGDLSMAAQSKLLRLMQERTFERVGGTSSRSVDVRIIGATHRNLEQLIEEGRFREDLYYRINVLKINLPPLRERSDDIALLATAFLKEFRVKYDKAHLDFDGETMRTLERYEWPGNVRELRNMIESLVVMNHADKISISDLPSHISSKESYECVDKLLDGTHSLSEIENAAIHATLSRANGNKSQAARVLGIGLKTLYRRLNEEGEDESNGNGNYSHS